MFFLLMIRRPPSFTRTYPLFPFTTLFRAVLTLVGGSPVSLASLLGLQDEAITLVAIDPAEALRAVAIVLEHAAFKHVIIVGVVGATAGRRLQPQQVAEAVDEGSEEHTSELQSLMRISYAVFCLQKKTKQHQDT